MSRADGETCAWCGSNAIQRPGRLATCPTCGAATTSPPPDDAELEAAYAGFYRPRTGRFAVGGDRILRLTRGSLARHVDLRAPAGPVLDVGAGDGSLLHALRARGREAIGLERTAADGVVAAELPAFSERAGEWAAVILWHSLEHLREPRSALDRACALLAPDGLIVLAVPNVASWQARTFGSDWFALDIPRHLVHLPATALTERLRSNGMRLERVSYWRGGQVVFGWLHGLVGTLPGHPSLYGAIRTRAAREQPLAFWERAVAVIAAAALLVPAVVLAGAEIAAGAGGTVMVEARRESDR